MTEIICYKTADGETYIVLYNKTKFYDFDRIKEGIDIKGRIELKTQLDSNIYPINTPLQEPG